VAIHLNKVLAPSRTYAAITIKKVKAAHLEFRVCRFYFLSL
jgi:hypothetical protein